MGVAEVFPMSNDPGQADQAFEDVGSRLIRIRTHATSASSLLAVVERRLAVVFVGVSSIQIRASFDGHLCDARSVGK
jgi:hypothetical protein